MGSQSAKLRKYSIVMPCAKTRVRTVRRNVSHASVEKYLSRLESHQPWQPIYMPTDQSTQDDGKVRVVPGKTRNTYFSLVLTYFSVIHI
jgi:hypothetical protein